MYDISDLAPDNDHCLSAAGDVCQLLGINMAQLMVLMRDANVRWAWAIGPVLYLNADGLAAVIAKFSVVAPAAAKALEAAESN